MKQTLTLTAAILAGALAAGAPAGQIDEGLQDIIDAPQAGRPIPVLVYLDEQVDVFLLDAQLHKTAPTLKVRHQVVVERLQATAAATQGRLAAHLDELAAQGRVEDVRSFWLVNAFALTATPDEIELLAQHEDVGTIYFDYEIELLHPIDYDPEMKGEGPALALGAPEPGLVAIRATEVWALGYTGAGVLVSSLDTGVEGSHPAVGSRWAGNDPAYAGNPEWAWFDPVTFTTSPQAWGSHGTHTMGTICGGAPGDQVGVAPGATWIHAAVIDRVSIAQTVADSILSFQWIVDPDGNPATIFDVPAVCSNSWGVTTSHGYPPCDTTFWSYLDACEAAGVVILFAAGNEGSTGLRRPGDRATTEYSTLAVAAVDGNNPSWPIASFSSRGPTFCGPGGAEAIKPDVSAPGVDVRSSLAGGGYGTLSGTSMATPHVAGVVALMREACPDLTVEELKQILYETAVDLGSAGEDNTFGWGMIDAYEAVQLALSMCGPSPPRAYGASYETPVDAPLSITLVATDHDEAPGGPLTYRVHTLPANGTLTDEGDDHVIAPGELPYTLVGNGNQVSYAPGAGYYGTDAFSFAADDGGSPPDGGEGDAATIAILVLHDPPTITSATLPDGYLGLPYGPTMIGVDGGQPALAWSVLAEQYAEDDLGSSLFAATGTDMNWNADDSSWQYALPFAFPYYGQVYSQVWVCSNGFIDFTSNSSDWSNSESEFANAVRIAPMWDDIRTNCGGSGDIYIDESVAGQVTIRWDGLLYNSSCTNTQVNLAVTLYEDGRIRFHYGAPNTGLTPTIGVSSGDGSNYFLSAYNGASSLGNAHSVEIFPPSSLPEGVELSETGVLSGIPLEFGTFEPFVRVVDALGRADQAQLTLVIDESGVPGDVNGDGVVDFTDLVTLLASWGPCAGCPADLDGNGFVEFNDLVTLLANWT